LVDVRDGISHAQDAHQGRGAASHATLAPRLVTTAAGGNAGMMSTTVVSQAVDTDVSAVDQLTHASPMVIPARARHSASDVDTECLYLDASAARSAVDHSTTAAPTDTAAYQGTNVRVGQSTTQAVLVEPNAASLTTSAADTSIDASMVGDVQRASAVLESQDVATRKSAASHATHVVC